MGDIVVNVDRLRIYSSFPSCPLQPLPPDRRHRSPDRRFRPSPFIALRLPAVLIGSQFREAAPMISGSSQ
jgi:hypothetical protein